MPNYGNEARGPSEVAHHIWATHRFGGNIAVATNSRWLYKEWEALSSQFSTAVLWLGTPGST